VLPAFLAIVVVAIGLPISATPVRADTTAQLEAKRAELLQQLAAITSQQSDATGALNSAEATYGQAAAALNTARSQLDALNAQLSSLAAGISTDQTQESAARNALATLTRATYESVSGDTVMTAVLSAKDFTAAMDSISGASSITTQIEGLEDTLTHDQADLATKQGQLQTDFAQASALENQLSVQSNQLLAIVASRDQIVEQFSGTARQLAVEIDEIDMELGGSTSVPSSGTCSNTFAYGDCTWYVATRRCIPWGGNADAWYYNAAKMGYQESSAPKVGAVAVWRAGGGGASWLGHVAYVEAVGPNVGVGSISVVPDGDFEISEMNWNSWDRVDYRLIPDGAGYMQGFIYGPG
jgi:surface antigen